MTSLDLHTATLFLMINIGGAAAEEVSRSASLHEWIGEIVVLWAAKASPDFLALAFGFSKCAFASC